MKTVKIIFIVGLLSVFMGCSKVVKDAGDWSVEEAGKGNLSVSVVYDDLVLKSLTDYTNATSDEKAVKKLDVLVFDKVTGALNASMSLESMTDECLFEDDFGFFQINETPFDCAAIFQCVKKFKADAFNVAESQGNIAHGDQSAQG